MVYGIVPCDSQLWVIQCTWSIGLGTTELLQGLESLLRGQISAIHRKKGIVPLQISLSGELQYS